MKTKQTDIRPTKLGGWLVTALRLTPAGDIEALARYDDGQTWVLLESRHARNVASDLMR